MGEDKTKKYLEYLKRKKEYFGELINKYEECKKQIQEIENSKNGKILHALKLSRLKKKKEYLEGLIHDERALLDIDDSDKQRTRVAL